MVQVFNDSIDEISNIKYANMAGSYGSSPTLDGSAAQLPPRKRSATHAIQYDNVKIMRDDDKVISNIVDAVVPLSADVEVTRKLSKLSMVLSLFHLHTHTHTQIQSSPSLPHTQCIFIHNFI